MSATSISRLPTQQQVLLALALCARCSSKLTAVCAAASAANDNICNIRRSTSTVSMLQHQQSSTSSHSAQLSSAAALRHQRRASSFNFSMQLQRSVGSLQQFWFQLKFSASDFAAVSAFSERPAPVSAPASAFSEQLCSFSSFSVCTTAAAAAATVLHAYAAEAASCVSAPAPAPGDQR